MTKRLQYDFIVFLFRIQLTFLAFWKRECERKNRSFPGLAFDVQPPALFFDQVAADCKSQAGSRIGGPNSIVNLVKRLEDFFKILLCDANTAIFYFKKNR